jgi:hypothetical protein
MLSSANSDRHTYMSASRLRQVQSLNADGNGTAGLSCGSGLILHIQVSPERPTFNVIDVSSRMPAASSKAWPSVIHLEVPHGTEASHSGGPVSLQPYLIP